MEFTKSEIVQINNFDGVRWYGVFVSERLVWTGCEDSCKSYAELLDIRAKPPVLRRDRAAAMRERTSGRFNWASYRVHDGPPDMPVGSERDTERV